MDSEPRAADTAELLDRAGEGDDQAVAQLLDRHRQKLRRMVSVRIDPRLSARVDPSDVVQETLADASVKFEAYLRDRPMPFYPWLRHLAWQRLVGMHRRHVQAQKRSVRREEAEQMGLSEGSAVQLAEYLAADQTSPSGQAVTRELRQRVRTALAQLRPRDREILILLYLEQLPLSDIAAVVGVSEKAVTMRHLRALQRLGSLLQD